MEKEKRKGGVWGGGEKTIHGNKGEAIGNMDWEVRSKSSNKIVANYFSMGACFPICKAMSELAATARATARFPCHYALWYRTV